MQSTARIVIAALLTVTVVGRFGGVSAAQQCGDPDGVDGITVIDAANVLRAAVDLPSNCAPEPQTCDVDGDESITVIDAASVLRRAVGLPGANDCPLEPPLPTTTPTPVVGATRTPTPTVATTVTPTLTISTTVTPTPVTTATPSTICGNEILESGEDCETGPGQNLCAAGDQCTNCQCPRGPNCGDGIVNEASEACDGADASSCPGTCTPFCQCPIVGACFPNGSICIGGANQGQVCDTNAPNCPSGICDLVQCNRNTDCGTVNCCDLTTCTCNVSCPSN